MIRVGVIANPLAGRHQGARLAAQLAAELARRDLEVQLYVTTFAGEASELIAGDAGSCDRVVVVGGDGTVAEVVRGLLSSGRDLPVGVLPLGNANVVARELGVPADPAAVARLVEHGAARRFDVGLADQEPFLAMMGTGFDAEVLEFVHALRRAPLLRHGYRLAADALYGLGGVAKLVRVRSPWVDVVIDDAPARHFRSIILCNTRTYGKGWAVAPEADAGDGWLDFQGRRRAGMLASVRSTLAALRCRATAASVNTYGRGRHFVIRADRPFSYHLDGDPQPPVAQLEVTLLPRRVEFLIPTAEDHS